VIFVFVMDPVPGINRYTDTTYVLMREAQTRGHTVYYTPVEGLHVINGAVHAHVQQVQFNDDEPFYQLAPVLHVCLDDVDVIFQRKDPPFDFLYLNSTHLLDRVSPRVFIMNAPRGLREANEKLYSLHFPECTPRSMVTSRADDAKEFLRDVGGQAVIKRLDRSGGVGVFLLDVNDKNCNGLIESVTEEGRRYALVQEYLPAVVEGDKRIIVLDGEPVGAVLRKPRPDDLRGNIHSGATTHACAITDEEREMCRLMAPRFRADGLWFVGLDVIGGRVTEINVTSPTGFQEIARLTGVHLEKQFIDFAEAESLRRKAAQGENA
jgi:glutathione synthase